ncbi:MAG TPA: zinc ABC transporter substrate-binding protein, partial [Bacteroidales bacterium]|nr:zinc ABC transporter substrate-binding protein [Bacteroidales bacterium]
MKKIPCLFAALILVVASCSGPGNKTKDRVITVSIPPFKYFVEAIADSDFVVNVMLPPGADHHSWEPLPGQITALAGSEAFLTDGFLGFEYSWMDRFKEVNPSMKISDLARGIDLMRPTEGDHHDDHVMGEEGTDPHYWMSPKEAYVIAANVRDVLAGLNPSRSSFYEANYMKLAARIAATDTIVTHNLKNLPSRSFMIFHPALSYLARDYNLEQVSFENEGKMPSPARMKELVDMTKEKGMRV